MKAADFLADLQYHAEAHPEAEVLVSAPYDPEGTIESVKYQEAGDCIVIEVK